MEPSALYGVMITIMIASLVAGYVPAKLASKQKILDTIKTVE
jgi:ABC-type lipoprotein release transport system permease subunit